MPNGISVLVYDADDHGKEEGQDDLLGRVYISIAPKWVYFHSRNIHNALKL